MLFQRKNFNRCPFSYLLDTFLMFYISPCNVTLSLKYLTKLPIPFYDHIENTATYIKFNKKSKETMNSFRTWLYHIWSINLKINRIFLNYNACSLVIWKINYINEKFFHQSSYDVDMIYQRSWYMCWFIYHWTWSVKISKNLFCDTFERSRLKPPAIISMGIFANKYCNICFL